MTSTTTGRRPKFNLHRDGFEDCAEHIAVTISRTGGDFAVYIDHAGDVRVIQDASAKQKHRGRDELLGWYRKGIGIELIEDDLLTWLRASSARAAA